MYFTLIDRVIKKGFDQKEAEAFIRTGKVLVNNEAIIVPSIKVKESDEIQVKELKKWVSRGAYKLLKAIEVFKIDFKNKVVLDIGSSTGGFTQVALNYKAKKVFAVDVGTNQLDYKLRNNPKVIAMEQTNLKIINSQMIGEKIDIVLADVSFISLKHVFNTLKQFTDYPLKIMALIKPQFEADRKDVENNGFVTEEKHQNIINKIITYAKDNGFVNKGIKKSPLTGKSSKNIEYVSLFERIENE